MNNKKMKSYRQQCGQQNTNPIITRQITSYHTNMGKVIYIMMILSFTVLLSSCASLTQRMLSNDSNTFSSAFVEFNNLNEKSKADRIPLFIKALKDENEDVRNNAAYALGKIGPTAKDAVPALIVALKDENRDIRNNVAYALGKMGVDGVPALIKALNDEDWHPRNGAAYALGMIGPDAKDAVLALAKALNDENDAVSNNAAKALVKIGPVAVPSLIVALKNNNSDIRNSAVTALGKIGPDAENAVPALIEALKDNNTFVRPNAVDALGKIGFAAKDAIPALIKVLKDKDSIFHSNVADALEQIGTPAAKDAVTAYQNALIEQQEKEKAKEEATLEIDLIKAAKVYRSAREVYYAMGYALKYQTLSQDIPRKATELQKYAINNLVPAAHDFNRQLKRFADEEGMPIRDLAITYGFLDLL